MAHYAWSEIVHGAEVDKDGTFLSNKSVPVGSEVNASKLGISKEDFDALVESGAVRTDKYPVPEGDGRSPIEYLRTKAAEMEGSLDLGTRGSIFADPLEDALAESVKEPKGASG